MSIIAGTATGTMRLINHVVVQFYFHKRRSFAFAVAQSGNCVGGLVSGPLMRVSLDTFGFKGNFLILCGLYLQNVVMGSLYRPLPRISSSAQKTVSVATSGEINDAEAEGDFGEASDENAKDAQRNKSSRKRLTALKAVVLDTIDFSVLKDRRAQLLFAGVPLFLFGTMSAVVNSVARAISIGVDLRSAAFLTTCFNLVGFCGRLTAGVIGDRLPHRGFQLASYTFLSACFSMGIVLTHSYLYMAIVYSGLGIFYGECDTA